MKKLLILLVLVTSCMAQTVHQATLIWVAPAAQTGITVSGYNIYRSTTSGGQIIGQHLNPAVITALTFVDTSVAAGTTYFYKVTTWCQPCLSGQQESAFSNEVTAVIPGNIVQPPTGLTVHTQ